MIAIRATLLLLTFVLFSDLLLELSFFFFSNWRKTRQLIEVLQLSILESCSTSDWSICFKN